MKLKIACLSAAALAAAFSLTSVRAQEGMGIGVMVGEPTGISFKNWLDNTHAVDGGLAWSFSENASLQMHADYLIHDFTVLKPTDLRGRMPVYYGLGGRIKFESSGSGRNDRDTLVGLRIPLGVAYYPQKSRIDIFAEIVPIMDLVPDTHADINVSVGARFYFQ